MGAAAPSGTATCPSPHTSKARPTQPHSDLIVVFGLFTADNFAKEAKRSSKGKIDFEIVPRTPAHLDDYDSDTHAELLALGKKMKKHTTAKALIDARCSSELLAVSKEKRPTLNTSLPLCACVCGYAATTATASMTTTCHAGSWRMRTSTSAHNCPSQSLKSML